MNFFRGICIAGLLFAGTAWADAITIQLKWHHQFQFAGYYVALQRGYYKDEGLDVRLVAGRPHLQPVDQVLKGEADYGVAASSVLFARAKGQPVVIVAPIFQHSPSVLISLAEKNIINPTDLRGRRIMLPGGIADAEIMTMLLRQGVDLSEVNILASSYNLDDLVAGRVDAYHGYATNEPFYLEEKGIAYRLMDPKRFGVDFYGDMLFTSEQEAAAHPERVMAVKRATLKGWRYALDHPESTIQLIRDQYRPDKTVEHLRFEADRVGALVMRDVVELGHVNLERLQSMADDLVATGLADERIAVSDMIFREPSGERILNAWIPFVATLAGSTLLFLAFIWYHRRRMADWQATCQTLQQQLEEQKTREPLTGLLSRRELLDRVDNATRPGVFMLIRMAGLGRLNHDFGFQVSDEIIRQISRLIRQQARRSDLVGRYTGGTIALFLPEATEEEADELGQRIRELVTLLPLAGPEGEHVTIGIHYAYLACQPDSGLERVLVSLEEQLHADSEPPANRF
jgi:diguanylate cyclase (GGDEF)-like protein